MGKVKSREEHETIARFNYNRLEQFPSCDDDLGANKCETNVCEYYFICDGDGAIAKRLLASFTSKQYTFFDNGRL